MHSLKLFLPVSFPLLKILLLICELLGEIGVSFFNLFQFFLYLDPAFSFVVYFNF